MTRSTTESQLASAYRWANREGGRVSPQAARVLIEILTYVDLQTSTAHPKRVTLACNLYATEHPSKAQLNVVSGLLTRLEDAGLIQREQTYHDNHLSVNMYWVHIGAKARAVPTSTGRCKPSTVGRWSPTSAGHREPTSTGHLKYPVEVSKEVSNEDRGRHLKVVK